MLIINWTPFTRTYWIPSFQYWKREAMWCVDVRFFRVQVCLYSRELGKKFLDAVGKGFKVYRSPRQVPCTKCTRGQYHTHAS